MHTHIPIRLSANWFPCWSPRIRLFSSSFRTFLCFAGYRLYQSATGRQRIRWPIQYCQYISSACQAGAVSRVVSPLVSRVVTHQQYIHTITVPIASTSLPMIARRPFSMNVASNVDSIYVRLLMRERIFPHKYENNTRRWSQR